MPLTKASTRRGLAVVAAVTGLTLPCGAAAGVASVYESVNQAADAYLHYSLARLMETSGLLSDALVQYRRAAAIDPGQCEIEAAMARVLLGMGRTEQAREMAEGLLTRCGTSEVVALAGAAMLAAGDAAAAEDVLSGPAADGEGPEELVGMLGQALALQGRTADALELYRKNARSDSLNAGAAYRYARALLASDRTEEALTEFRRAGRIDPENKLARMTLGRLLVALGEPEEAIGVLEPLASDPNSRETEHAALARAHAIVGNLARALDIVDSAIERFGASEDLLTLRGSILFDIGDVDEALVSYERALELSPDSVQALNFVAYTLADLELDPQRAVVLAERAVELAPESGIVRDTLGWAYFRTGRLEEAVTEIERAIALGEPDPVILEHLGDALGALGRTPEAVDAWRRALDMDSTRATAAEKIEGAVGGGAPAEGPAGEEDR